MILVVTVTGWGVDPIYIMSHVCMLGFQPISDAGRSIGEETASVVVMWSTRALANGVFAQLVALPETQHVGNATHEKLSSKISNVSLFSLRNLCKTCSVRYFNTKPPASSELRMLLASFGFFLNYNMIGSSVLRDQSTYPLPQCNLPEKWWLKKALYMYRREMWTSGLTTFLKGETSNRAGWLVMIVGKTAVELGLCCIH